MESMYTGGFKLGTHSAWAEEGPMTRGDMSHEASEAGVLTGAMGVGVFPRKSPLSVSTSYAHPCTTMNTQPYFTHRDAPFRLKKVWVRDLHSWPVSV